MPVLILYTLNELACGVFQFKGEVVSSGELTVQHFFCRQLYDCGRQYDRLVRVGTVYFNGFSANQWLLAGIIFVKRPFGTFLKKSTF